MIRPATHADTPRIFEIRENAGATPLSDPSALSEAQVTSLIDAGTLWVWQEADGVVAGCAGSDQRDGSIGGLLVAPGYEGKGIGRALLKAACEALRAAGHRFAVLTTAPGSRAERHYRTDGWSDAADNEEGQLLLRKEL